MDDVHRALRAIMATHTGHFVVARDTHGDYSVDTTDTMTNGKVRWFGGVQTKKNYVSYHLMPVYENPDLLVSISPELRARMQGKSCFNFKSVDPTLFDQLDDLTLRGVEDFAGRHGLTN